MYLKKIIFILILALLNCSANAANLTTTIINYHDKLSISHFTGYITTNDGLKLFYQTFKDNKTQTKQLPIIFLHGGPGLDQNYLLPQMAQLASTNLVTFYDQRGSGKSVTKSFDFTTINIARFVQDLEDVRKSLGYKEFILAGHSWGGLLAMNYAITYPQNLKQLILLNSSPATSLGLLDFINEFNQRTFSISNNLNQIRNKVVFKQGNPTIIKQFYQQLFSVYCYKAEDSRKLSLNFTPSSTLNGFKVLESFMQSLWFYNYDLLSQLQQLNIPSLIIHGDYDIIPVRWAQEIHENIPNSKLIIMKNCGHFPYIEQPNQFFELLNENLIN